MLGKAQMVFSVLLLVVALIQCWLRRSLAEKGMLLLLAVGAAVASLQPLCAVKEYREVFGEEMKEAIDRDGPELNVMMSVVILHALCAFAAFVFWRRRRELRRFLFPLAVSVVVVALMLPRFFYAVSEVRRIAEFANFHYKQKASRPAA